MAKNILFAVLILFGSGFYGCGPGGLGLDAVPDYSAINDVTITDKGTHFEVVLDYTHGATPRQMGTAYGLKIKEAMPDFEETVDSYLAEVTRLIFGYNWMRAKVKEMRGQLNPNYVEEIEGLASVFSGGSWDLYRDGRISRNEAYLLNLLGDVGRITECSGAAVFGPRSATGKNLTARLFDWGGGSKNQLNRIAAVTTIKNGDKSVCLIGYLGFLSVIAGFNDDRVFAGVLDSQSGAKLAFSADGKRSYMFDLRQALEDCATLDEVGNFMIDPAHPYTVNHLIFLSDPNESKVIENNFSGQGDNVHRALRTWDAVLHDGAVWDVDHAIACVNAFMLKGNYDNFSGLGYNTARWESFRRELLAKGDTVDFEELRAVASFHTGELPGAQDAGDIYNGATQNIILFEPDTWRLEIFFRPREGTTLPAQPTFVPVEVRF